LLEEFEITVDWRGYELRPGTPVGGMVLSALFPEPELGARRRSLLGFAERFGVTGLRLPERLPNTRKALALAEHARDEGRLAAFEERAMAAYWREGADLEDDAVLGRLALAVGLDPGRSLRAAADRAMQARVDSIRQEAEALGITAIPTFLFDGGPRVVGCQPYGILAAAAESAGAKRRHPR